MSSSLDGARLLGSYQLLSQLAVGGMAEIYVARTRGVGGFEKMVALKVIHPNFSADPDFVQMLVDEAKLSVQLQHANIVQTFDLGRVDEQYYIAMELIDGLDLYKLLRRASEHDVDFPFEVAAFIASEVAQGLDYAHRKRDARGRPLQIVHRDVSPQNVLVSYDGEVKIVDFGIAKAAMRGQQTAAGVIKGKYYYMSPEQAWGDPIDARTDIFSAGILLYEMIVGQMLYMEEDLEKLLDVVRKANIAPPSAKRMGVPRELEAIVMRALKKRADERWATAGELATALQQFVRGFAPDFSRARVATFVREVMGADPTSAQRDPRASTAHAQAQPNQLGIVSAIEVRDENSLIFSLSDLKPDVDDEPARATPSPRRADVATNVRGGGDFEENEQTIVDAGDTMLANLGVGDDDRTRPAGLAVRRGTPEVPSGKFDLGPEDPAADADLDAATLTGSDDDMPTGARELPARARAHETRRVDNPPLDDEDDATPDAIVDSPLSLATTAPAPERTRPSDEPEAPPARQARPTPLGVKQRQANAPRPVSTQATTAPAPTSARPPSQKVQPLPANAARPPSQKVQPLAANAARPPSQKVQTIAPPQANAPEAPYDAQPNAPAETLDEADTRQRTRRAPHRTPSPAPATFDDSEPEDTVSARGQRPPSQRVQPLAPPSAPSPPSGVPQLSAAAATLLNSPAQNPLGATSRPSPKQSFEEPTRIPPAQPPPLDSGRYVPGLFDAGDLDPLSSLAVPGDALPRKSSRGVLVGLGILGVIVAAAVAAVTLAGGGETRGTLTVVSLPPGAEVRVDAVAGSQQTPLTLSDVDRRASHHVRVSKSGYDVWESDVKFPAGEREVRVQAVLMPTVGTVEITSTPPGAEAIVNGRIRGMTPTTVGDLPPNDDVQIELRLRGYKVAHKTVSWASKRLLQVSIPLEKAK